MENFDQDILLGSWQSMPEVDELSREICYRVEFYPGGILAFVTIKSNKAQIIKMSYRVDGDNIFTHQDGRTDREITKFSVSDNCLILIHGGMESKFFKV